MGNLGKLLSLILAPFPCHLLGQKTDKQANENLSKKKTHQKKPHKKAPKNHKQQQKPKVNKKSHKQTNQPNFAMQYSDIINVRTFFSQLTSWFLLLCLSNCSIPKNSNLLNLSLKLGKDPISL